MRKMNLLRRWERPDVVSFWRFGVGMSESGGIFRNLHWKLHKSCNFWILWMKKVFLEEFIMDRLQQSINVSFWRHQKDSFVQKRPLPLATSKTALFDGWCWNIFSCFKIKNFFQNFQTLNTTSYVDDPISNLFNIQLVKLTIKAHEERWHVVDGDHRAVVQLRRRFLLRLVGLGRRWALRRRMGSNEGANGWSSETTTFNRD